MNKEIRVAVIGLDTSHSVELPRRMQAPDCPEESRVEGLRAVTCMRFETPFTNRQVLDERQQQLEAWGVRVTEDFNDAVSDCDAIMIEINDPAYHLEYFKKCMKCNKPIFLDKPLADHYENGKAIYDLAKENNVQVLSSSPLRYVQGLTDACRMVSKPMQTYCYGPLGIPPVGSGVIWYGVHCFEMLEKAMGRGAICVDTRKDPAGAVAIVEYPDKRRGIVELTEGAYTYGGTLRDGKSNPSYSVDSPVYYAEELKVIERFFRTGKANLCLDDALEVMNLLDAAAKSYESGKPEKLQDQCCR